MFPVIKRFMFSTRRVVWVCQSVSEAQSDVCYYQDPEPNSEHLTQNPIRRAVCSLYLIISCHNKCAVTLIDVEAVHSHPGTEGTYINVHCDGYKSNNQLYDESCLSASSWSILCCGAVWGELYTGAINVKYCRHTTHKSLAFRCTFREIWQDFPKI